MCCSADVLLTKISSRYTKTKSSPLQTVPPIAEKLALRSSDQMVSEGTQEAEWCDDCSLADVFCSYRNLVVATYQVDHRENRSTRELRVKVLYVWHRIAVGRRDVIEASVVATRSPTAGVLRHHVQGKRPRTV